MAVKILRDIRQLFGDISKIGDYFIFDGDYKNIAKDGFIEWPKLSSISWRLKIVAKRKRFFFQEFFMAIILNEWTTFMYLINNLSY